MRETMSLFDKTVGGIRIFVSPELEGATKKDGTPMRHAQIDANTWAVSPSFFEELKALVPVATAPPEGVKP
jgi:hypothetical protein